MHDVYIFLQDLMEKVQQPVLSLCCLIMCHLLPRSGLM